MWFQFRERFGTEDVSLREFQRQDCDDTVTKMAEYSSVDRARECSYSPFLFIY